MRFLVSRTSQWGTENAPVKVAVFERFTRTDRRTCRARDLPGYNGQDEAWWYAEGENHREELGPRGGFRGIARDFPDGASGWFIHIETLEELLKLNDQEGNLILTWNDDGDPIREIEIYDGYRE